jgi:hypothetical protein
VAFCGLPTASSLIDKSALRFSFVNGLNITLMKVGAIKVFARSMTALPLKFPLYQVKDFRWRIRGYLFRTESHSENKINPHNLRRTVMKHYGKYQEAFCTKVGNCRRLKAVFGLAILAIVASSAQAQKVTWGASVQLDDGFAPRVAASGTTVVQVHQATSAEGPLSYRTAHLGPNGTIQWFGSGSLQYDNGFAPSVAVTGTDVVEVHQGDPGTIRGLLPE